MSLPSASAAAEPLLNREEEDGAATALGRNPVRKRGSSQAGGAPGIDWSAVDRFISLRRFGPRGAGQPDDVIGSDELLFRTYREYQKGREFRILFAFSVAVFALCFICLANRVDFDALRSNYFVQQSIKQTARFEQFRKIRTVDDVYPWLHGALDNLFDIAPGARSTPVGLVLVRQLRINSDIRCGNETFSQFGFLGTGRCSNDAEHNTTTFPVDPPQWRANKNRDDGIKAQDVRGTYLGINSADDQFEIHVPLYDPIASRAELRQLAHVNVSDMQDRAFFDAFTASFSVDTLFFHPTLKRYSRASFLIEQLPSRYLVPSYFGTTFKLVKLGGDVANTTFAMDLVVVMFAIAVILEVMFSVRVRYDFIRSFVRAAVTFQHFLSLLIFGMLAYVIGYRFSMWSTFDGIDFEPYAASPSNTTAPETIEWLEEQRRAAFHDLSTATSSLETSYQVFAMALIPIAIKMLMYFQDVRGFNIIHNTLLAGLRDLVTVLAVAVVVLTFFALSGNVFFGGFSSEFLTFTVAFSTLARLLVSADPYIVDRMIEQQPRVGALYFFLFFLSLWLVLLNFVLGIVVSGVSVAMSEHDNDGAAASTDTLGDVVERYVLMISDHYLPHPNLAQSASTFAASRAVRALPPVKQRLKLAWNEQIALHESVIAVSDYSQRFPAITRDDAYHQLRMVPPSMRARLFDACLSIISATQAATESMERQSAEVGSNVAELGQRMSELLQEAERGAKEHGESLPDDSFDLPADGGYSFAGSFAPASFGGTRHGSSGGLKRTTLNASLARTRKFNLGFKKKIEI